MLRRLRDPRELDEVIRRHRCRRMSEDGYFDDQRWTVRYLVVNAWQWLVDNSVLVSPMAVRLVEWGEVEDLHSRCRASTLQNAPKMQQGAPLMAAPWRRTVAGGSRRRAKPAPHLRSAKEISGYHIQALDGEIGHVEDFLFDGSDVAMPLPGNRHEQPIGGRTVLVSPGLGAACRLGQPGHSRRHVAGRRQE